MSHPRAKIQFRLGCSSGYCFRVSNQNAILPNHEDVVAAVNVLAPGKKLRFKMDGREVSVHYRSADSLYIVGVDGDDRDSVASTSDAIERAWHHINAAR
jgi:hypothetical protein